MNQKEREYVYDSYCKISNDFDSTRNSVWNCVKVFLDTLESNETLLEIGCGNGKNLLYRKDLIGIGTDFCPNMIEICSKKGIQGLVCNALELPFRNENMDNVMSIAVFHHLSTEERRREALEDMVRVLKRGGKGLVVVWAAEQKKGYIETNINHEINKGDQLIRWHGKGNYTETSNAQRYYYFYDEYTFGKYIDYLKSRHTIHVNSLYWELGNWICSFTKL